MYNLLDECFKIRLSGIEKATISQLYSKLSHDKRIISIEDHGVGSKKLGAKRKISTIIKTSSSKGKYGRLLYQLARYTKPKQMLELGTSLGLGTMHLYLGAPDATLTTVEGCPETYRIAGEHLPKTIHRTRSTFDDYLNELDTDAPKFDLVFIDADKSNYSNYFHLIIDKMNKGGVILSDNVLWSGKVVEKLDPKDQDTKALLEYNTLLNTDKRIETVLLPIRDGLTISRVC